MDVLRVRLVRKLFIWDWGFLVINIDLNFEHASEIILFLRESSLMNGLKFQLPSASSRPSQSLVLQKLKSSNSQMDVIRCIHSTMRSSPFQRHQTKMRNKKKKLAISCLPDDISVGETANRTPDLIYAKDALYR
jgi:hypothetical protein